jgi:3-oxoacyl-[acyl-carrier protein] reductase
MTLLKGKTALVTGAARGIGKAIALKFASEGADVVFTDLQIDENALATQKEIESFGVKGKGYASNASGFEETHKVVEEIVKEFGRIDILVNNAGITRDGLMMRMTEQQWDMVIGVNLKSAFNFIHAVTPVMMKQKSGSIINMASVVGVSGNAGQANYAASKAGMIALAKSVAKELGSRGIRANAIAPGFIITDMTAALPDDVKAGWAKQIPLRRGGTPEDVANVATFLASDLSSYVTGQTIHCCGGMNTCFMDVIYEDNHLIAVNKTCGEIVQGDKTGDTPLSELLGRWLKEKYQKPGNVFVGVPHRLDRPVSGVVLFAKTEKALSRLNDMFRLGKIKKTYWAIVKNPPPKEEDELTHWLVRNERQNKSYAYGEERPGAKQAILHYRLIARSHTCYLMEIDLKTGRHHQIRAQLSATGCPVKGDLKYGAERSNPDGGISLHARSAVFTHPVSKETVTIVAPVPCDNLWANFGL